MNLRSLIAMGSLALGLAVPSAAMAQSYQEHGGYGYGHERGGEYGAMHHGRSGSWGRGQGGYGRRGEGMRHGGYHGGVTVDTGMRGQGFHGTVETPRNGW